jgi:hypothetical protein
VSNSVRWTEEQLANFKRRRETLTVSEPIQLVPQPEKVSKIERRFDQQLVENDVPLYQRNYFFLPDRDLELDFAWPALKVAVEVQGMAHRIKGKFKRDIEKRALAMLAGWRVLEVDGSAIRDGRAMEWLKAMLFLSFSNIRGEWFKSDDERVMDVLTHMRDATDGLRLVEAALAAFEQRQRDRTINRKRDKRLGQRIAWWMGRNEAKTSRV